MKYVSETEKKPRTRPSRIHNNKQRQERKSIIHSGIILFDNPSKGYPSLLNLQTAESERTHPLQNLAVLRTFPYRLHNVSQSSV